MVYALWVVLIITWTGKTFFVYGSPLWTISKSYPQESKEWYQFGEWDWPTILIVSLGLPTTALTLIFLCIWCPFKRWRKLFPPSSSQSAEASRAADATPPPAGDVENNNGPISLREMQNIANNNAGAYIASAPSRDSVVEFEPLPLGLPQRQPDDLARRCADWFVEPDFPRSRLQYLREIDRGWFGRIVEGEIDEGDGRKTRVAVKILNQSATHDERVRFLDESRLYRDVGHENLLRFIGKCLQHEPWIMIYEFCSMNVRQYLAARRGDSATPSDSGATLRLMRDAAAALAHLHSTGRLFGSVICCESVMVRLSDGEVRAVLGAYGERNARANHFDTSSEVWWLGVLLWEIGAGGATVVQHPPPRQDLVCPYSDHLYQVMQMCWNNVPESRPSAAQVHAMINHLYLAQIRPDDSDRRDECDNFEERWQRLKPNTIAKVDEHTAIVHAPSTSASNFTGSDQDLENAQTIQDSISIEMDTAVSKSSSVFSDQSPVKAKSDSLTNLHGSLEDVKRVFVTQNDAALPESVYESLRSDYGFSDKSFDPWLKDVIGGDDDASYYRDVSDVIKSLDNILNSEKTSSSESSHHASPSRDNLSLECRNNCHVQSSLVKSPGIVNFKTIFNLDESNTDSVPCEDNGDDQDMIENHSFECNSDKTSQTTLRITTPETPDMKYNFDSEEKNSLSDVHKIDEISRNSEPIKTYSLVDINSVQRKHFSTCPTLKNLCIALISNLNDKNLQYVSNVKDCFEICDSKINNNSDNLKLSKCSSKKEDPSMTVTINSNSIVTDENVLQPELILDQLNPKENSILVTQYSLESIKYMPDDTCDIKPDLLLENSKKCDLLKSPSNEMCNQEIPIPFLKKFDEEEKCGLMKPNSNHNDIENFLNILDSVEVNDASVSNLKSKFDNCTIEESKNNTESESFNSPEIKCESDNSHLLENCLPHVSGFSLTHDNNTEIEKSINNARKEALITTIENSTCDNNNSTTSNEKSEKLLKAMGTSDNVAKEFEEALINATIREIHLNTNSELVVSNSCSIKNSDAIDDTKNEKSLTDSIPRHDICQLPLCDLQTKQYLDGSSLGTIADYSNEDKIVMISHESCENCHINDVINKGSFSEHLGISENVGSGKSNEFPVEIIGRDTNNDDNKYDKLRLNGADTSSELISDNTSKLSVKEINGIQELNESYDSTVYLDLTNDKVSKNNIMICSLTNDGNTAFIISNNNLVDSTLLTDDSTKYYDLPSSENENVLSPKPIHDQSVFASTPNENEDTERIEVLNSFNSPNVCKSFLANEVDKNSCDSYHSHLIESNSDTKNKQPNSNKSSSEIADASKNIECFDFPKEELLAFSTNFNDIYMETPSPLRDCNFLIEVPDIYPNLNDVETTTKSEDHFSIGINKLMKEKIVLPSTPPNSPGSNLTPVCQNKYLVDIDFESTKETEAVSSDSELMNCKNNMGLEITSKLAIADNENNLNLESCIHADNQDVKRINNGHDSEREYYFSGNGGYQIETEENTAIGESMKALRDELELKLPLAQVALIEPPTEDNWNSEFPPPPEKIISYNTILSPIAEETSQQLSAFQNDLIWPPTRRTDSSESYLEPCNNSTDEVTDLPTGLNSAADIHATYTVKSKEQLINNTYTLQKEDDDISNTGTINADSLLTDKTEPEMNKTYVQDETSFNIERLSQVSPCLISPSLDVPEISKTQSTNSKITIPTDDETSKPSDNQCLSKATSIDSWCSNDTLYNLDHLEELAMDQDAAENNYNEEDKSESSRTLTQNEEDNSHCSTYIIHDSESSSAKSLSGDGDCVNARSTQNEIHSETKNNNSLNDAKPAQEESMLLFQNDSYCKTEVMSNIKEAWQLPRPELIRKSPVKDNPNLSKIKTTDEIDLDSPKLTHKPSVKKLESVDLLFEDDEILETKNTVYNNARQTTQSATSTPLIENLYYDNEIIEPVNMILPEVRVSSPTSINISNISGINIEDKSLNRSESKYIAEQTPNYSDFESSVKCKPQDMISKESVDSLENGANSADFLQFQTSIRNRPQDISSLINASLNFIHNERISSIDCTNVLNVNNIPSLNESTINRRDVALVSNNLNSFNNDTYEFRASPNLCAEDELLPENSTDVPIQTNKIDQDTLDTNATRSENDFRSAAALEIVLTNVNSVDETASETKNCHEHKKETYTEAADETGKGSEPYECIVESNVDDVDFRDQSLPTKITSVPNNISNENFCKVSSESQNLAQATRNFLQNEKENCRADFYLPLMNDIRFTGPSEEMMSTSFTQNSSEKVITPNSISAPISYIIKEWDTDSDSNSTNSSSGEFIWKHQEGGTKDNAERGEKAACDIVHEGTYRELGANENGTCEGGPYESRQYGGQSHESRSCEDGDCELEGCEDSDNSGSEGSETEFVPSSWDCLAAPGKSSLRDHQNTPESKKRVAFKRQKYQCVYEYPRETPDDDSPAAAYAPDLSTYADWDTSYAVDAEAGYGRLFGSPGALDLYQLQAGAAFSADYDEDFFITSSARPFESLGVMSTVSQFFPGMHSKPHLIDVRDEIENLPSLELPQIPSSLQLQKPLDFTTPDSGVEDITPGSTTTEDGLKCDKDPNQCWKMVDSTSSSESVSPSSPGGETLGGLRHTRDRLKLDLPQSPHLPSPKHNRVFNFVLDKPKKQKPMPESDETTESVVEDDKPISSVMEDTDVVILEGTLTGFSKCSEEKVEIKPDPVTADEERHKSEDTKIVEIIKGEGSLLDSGDEDSGIESSSKATLNINVQTPNVL